MPEDVTVTFLYALGQRVRLANDPTDMVWRITARHYNQQPPVSAISYSVVPVGVEGDTPAYVAGEADLSPVEDA